MAEDAAPIVWLASYPKSGNTWLRMFLRNLQAGAAVPADINDSGETPIASHRAWLDGVLGLSTADLLPAELDRLRPQVYDWPRRAGGAPALHKIHDAWTVNDDGVPVGGSAARRAVYVVRNPLAVAVSLAHHRGCSVDEAITLMADAGHALAGDAGALRSQVRQRLLGWSGHVRSWTEAPGLAVHVMRYEDMALHPGRSFRNVARFLGLPAGVERIAQAVRFSRFDELARQESAQGFRERPTAMTRFFRAGRTDGWRHELTPPQVRRVVEAHGEVMARFGYLDNVEVRRGGFACTLA